MKFMKSFAQFKAQSHSFSQFSSWHSHFAAAWHQFKFNNESSKFNISYSNFGLRPSKVM